MFKKPFDTADWTSIGFMVLYLAGAIYNARQGIGFYTILWSLLFVINCGLFIYRKLKK